MNTLHGLVDLKNTFVGRFLVVLVSFAMVLSCFNIAAFADDEQESAAENPSAEQPAAGGADGSDDGAGAAVQDGADAQAPEPSPDGASSEAPEPSGGPSSEAGAETELGSAESDAAVTEHETEAGLGEAVVSFEFDDNSYAKVAEQTIAFPQTSLKVVLHKDMEFIPAASTDYAVATVAAKSAASGEEIALIEKDGVYTVPADHVDSTLLIKVTSEKVAAENGDQPKADESPAALLIGSRAGDANTVRIAVGGSTTLEGAGVGAEAHEWFWQRENSGDIYLQEILKINVDSPYLITSLPITGKTLGTITLTHRWGTDDWGAVKSEQGRETFTIEVGQTGVGAEPTGLTSLKPSVVSLERFGAAKLKPVFEPEGASASVAWSSSDSSIASVNRDGLVTAVNPGQATITAAVPGTDLTASAQVTVTESQAKGTTAYFYVIRPDAHPGDLNNDSWLYVGKGSINVSNIKNTSGGPLKYNKKQYSLDVNNRVISYPDERDLKQVIAGLYKVSYDEVTISFSPYKISYPNGAVGADGKTPIASGPCYHVDMTVEIQTPQEASATDYLWDAGTSGYEPVENYVLDRGATTSPSGSYPEMKKGSDGTMYRFDGWYDNEARTGTPVSFPYAVEEGATFYAKYLAMPAYKVFYDGGADDVTSVPSDPDVYDVGARATVKAAPERLGYEFEGWVDAEGTVYQPGEQIIMPSDDVTLTALWTEHIEMVTLTYDANGGSGTVPDPVEIQPGTVVTQFASGEGLSNATATFKGWSESADGLVPVESLAMNGDKTLYAIWVDEYAIEYQVYTYANQESAVAPNFVAAQPENAPTTVEVKAGSIGDDASAETVKAIAKLPDAVSYPEYGIGTQVIPGDSMADVEKAYYACELDNGAKKIIAKYENQVFVNELSDGAVGVRNLDPSYEDALRQGKITVRTHYVDASGEEVDHAKLSGDKTTVHAPVLAETATGTVTEELYFAWSQNDNKIDLLVTDTAADDGWVLNKVVHSGGSAWVRSAADGFQYIAVTGDTAVDIYLTPEYTVRYFETTADGSVELTDMTQVATSLMGSGMQNVLPSGMEATEALTVQPLPEKAGYRYTGWNTSADMGGTTVEAESQLDLASIDGATRTMNLYAASEPLLYEVAYRWTGLPSERLYDAEGAEIGTLVEPNRLTGLVIGDEYPIDDTYTDGYTVYTQDEFGNRTASYTFSGWYIDGTAASGEQTMGDRNVLATGRWVASPIPVPSHGVSYDWGTENVPGGVTLPASLEGLVPGRPYAVDTVYAAGYSVNETDEYGNVTGTYTFSGWHIDGSAVSGERIMGDEDVAVTGSWSYAEQTVARYNVVYGWDLPDNAYYDAVGTAVDPTLPASLTGLVNGQPYTIDALFAQGAVVYTHDENGNRSGSYTFGGWSDPGNGVMGEADVLVSGTWVYEAIAVPLPVPTPVPTPTTPDTPIANALPPAVTAPIDAAAQALQNTYETVIGEEPTPLAGPAEETISDNDTPLAGGFDAHDPACWVHFYIILGMILSALYVIAVVARRRRFITVLNGYEDSLFGRDGNRGGKGVA